MRWIKMILITKLFDSSKLNLFRKLHVYDIVGQQKFFMIINHTIRRAKYLNIFRMCINRRNIKKIQNVPLVCYQTPNID